MSAKLLLLVLSLCLFGRCCVADFDYGQALTKSLLYFEAQRSGKLQPEQRVQWRGDSGLDDGKDNEIDLSRGYYDAGDNVKFGFPMAYTLTMLSWGAIEFGSQLAAKNELNNTVAAIKWGTDYLLRANPDFDILYVEVGDGISDHQCWQRPEDMNTSRTSYKIDKFNPGSDIAGETAAAMAAASIVLWPYDSDYASNLRDNADSLFDFAKEHRGVYQKSIPVVKDFYSSSGFEDELQWAAAWLYLATGQEPYLDYLRKNGNGGERSMFSWDDKYVGVQTLVSKLIFDGKVTDEWPWSGYRGSVGGFLCSVMQKGNNNVKMSPGGMLWWQPWNNFQYTTSAMFALAVHADHLIKSNRTMECTGGTLIGSQMMEFVQKQVNYILGANPKNMSYMVGYGAKYPVKVHHRGASIVSIKKDPAPVTCKGGFDQWYNKDAPNPNVLEGAIVEGPGMDDEYKDSRDNFQQAEPATVNTAPLVGVLARLA